MAKQQGQTPRSPKAPDQERLREICWDLGSNFPAAFAGDHVTLAAVHPPLGYLHWHLQKSSTERLSHELGDAFHGSSLVVRVYDVTDILFDGFNAHSFFDLEVGADCGNYYLNAPRLERDLMAEIGFRLRDHSFRALARSSAVRFDRDRPSGKFHLGGLYVGKGFQRVFPIENVADAPVFERLNYELQSYDRRTPLSLALIYLGADPVAGAAARLGHFLDEVIARCEKYHVRAQRFGDPQAREAAAEGPGKLTQLVAASARNVVSEIQTRHAQRPFDLIHCHDWSSVPAGLEASAALGLPLVLSLHSTEDERSSAAQTGEEAEAIRHWERQAIEVAGLVIVPHSSTRQQLINLYDAPADKVVIIPDILEEQRASAPDPAQEKRNLHLSPEGPVVLFSGEISHASGADLLVAALITICRENHAPQFVFAGQGPLKDELQGQVWNAGLGHRCRFLGDVPADWFVRILTASDFVVIPARTWQDEGLAQLAISYGKPVLTTHQSHIRCIEHGQNGLITYDNPGSIIWGVRELLANPMRGNMLRLLARQRASHTQSLESVAAEHYLVYERALSKAGEVRHG